MVFMHASKIVLVTADAHMRLDILAAICALLSHCAAVQSEAVPWSRCQFSNPLSVAITDDEDTSEQSPSQAKPGYNSKPD
ncbi:hypothetical protein N7451_012103 [Penicillium sp. IBT 35674x]|nr:hypothetical protein N7451_012086 [Penicillium sp. IBT 35674x]KAJ5982003.1 hypothetical protein N7451_012103 [Penicillium sp. IBT 35674x]